jgi:hypothetical protein
MTTMMTTNHSARLSIGGVQQLLQTFSGILKEFVCNTLLSVEQCHTQMYTGKEITMDKKF